MADITETATNDELSMTNETASTANSSGSQGGTGGRSKVRDTVKSKLAEQRDALRDQAQAKAREYAEQGKAKATDTLTGVSRFIDETARSLDDQLGADIGEYVHRAAAAVEGFTETIQQKDVEELLDDARDLVRRNPALAIGAAAAVGFVLVRLLKSTGTLDTQSPSPATAGTSGADSGQTG